MCEWTNCVGAKFKPQGYPHPPSVSENEPLPQSRFEFTDEDTFGELSKGLVPANTGRSTKWALKVFQLSCEQRNQRCPGDAIPEDFINTVDPVVLNTHLSCFAVETRMTDGSKYPPATIHQLLCGLLRHMRNINPGCLNILNKKDPQFKLLHGTLDALFHKLH